MKKQHIVLKIATEEEDKIKINNKTTTKSHKNINLVDGSHFEISRINSRMKKSLFDLDLTKTFVKDSGGWMNSSGPLLALEPIRFMNTRFPPEESSAPVCIEKP